MRILTYLLVKWRSKNKVNNIPICASVLKCVYSPRVYSCQSFFIGKLLGAWWYQMQRWLRCGLSVVSVRAHLSIPPARGSDTSVSVSIGALGESSTLSVDGSPASERDTGGDILRARGLAETSLTMQSVAPLGLPRCSRLNVWTLENKLWLLRSQVCTFLILLGCTEGFLPLQLKCWLI